MIPENEQILYQEQKKMPPGKWEHLQNIMGNDQFTSIPVSVFQEERSVS